MSVTALSCILRDLEVSGINNSFSSENIMYVLVTDKQGNVWCGSYSISRFEDIDEVLDHLTMTMVTKPKEYSSTTDNFIYDLS